MQLIFFSVILFAIAAFLFKIYQKLNYFSDQGIPGTKPKFLFGHTKESLLGRKNLIYEIDDVYRYAKDKRYPFTGFYMLLKPYFIIIDPELVKKILITDFKVFRNNDFSELLDKRKDPILALNPFFMVDNGWKEKRAEITSATTKNKLKSIYPFAIDTTRKLIDFVGSDLAKPYDIRDLSKRYTCDMISNSIFNVDAHSFTADHPEIYIHCKKIMSGILRAFSTLFPQQMFPTESSVFFKHLTLDAIRHRIESGSKRDDFLTHIISSQQKKGLSDDEVVGQMWSIFMDSFETSSVALNFMLYELSKNQRVQDKLRQEVLLNLEDDQISFDRMMELEYLDQVFHEALRLHPPLIYTTRICSENYEIEGAKGHKYQMRKGDVALISMHSIHRDPDHYLHPELFEPERFDALHGGVKNFFDQCVLLPFGLGPRICAGVKLGHVIVKTAVIEILKSYKIVIDESVPENLEIGPDEFVNVVTSTLLVNFHKL